MKIIPLASDSLGTRSMCTFVETDSISILIDPGVALGPRRFRLPPHPIEYERLREHRDRIIQYSGMADVIIVTHYHYDHHMPDIPQIYRGKITLVKHPSSSINLSQKKRAGYFLEKLKDIPSTIDFPDGKRYRFEDTEIIFSPPVFHGTGPRLGYVLMISISEGDRKFLYTSDVEGPCIPDQIEFILQEKPDTVMVDGPMTYMLGYRYSLKSLEVSNNNLKKLVDLTDVKNVILDHHLLRDSGYREKMQPFLEYAETHGVEVQTSAEYSGNENDMLEAHRKELYERYGNSMDD